MSFFFSGAARAAALVLMAHNKRSLEIEASGITCAEDLPPDFDATAGPKFGAALLALAPEGVNALEWMTAICQEIDAKTFAEMQASNARHRAALEAKRTEAKRVTDAIVAHVVEKTGAPEKIVTMFVGIGAQAGALAQTSEAVPGSFDAGGGVYVVGLDELIAVLSGGDFGGDDFGGCGDPDCKNCGGDGSLLGG